ncbi:MAG: hypothetical protein K9K76_09600 [Halanaerobiales bacterium]|nr:hypothetical protein [Halanaerobiales bacterium]
MSSENNKIFYTGIGSHDTPKPIKDIIEKLAYLLGENGYILRSGGSKGADTAFEVGAKKSKSFFEIFLPWGKFNNREGEGYINTLDLTNYQEAVLISKKHHPNFLNLKEESKKLIVRDTYQVLGIDLNTPSKFMVCWTKDGCITDRDRTEFTGGTGQAISIASKKNIPIFNLKLNEHKRIIKEWIVKLS